MTTSTVFTSVPYNQNAYGIAPVPANTVVNAGAPVNRHTFTLTVSPASGWAKARTSAGPDGINFPHGGEIECSPGIGTSAAPGGGSSEQGGWQYFTGEIFEVSPGASATLTVTY